MSLNEEQWTLTERKFKIAGGIELTLSDKALVIKLMGQDVPHWDSQLYTMPHLTRIRRKDLFSEKDQKYDYEVAQVYNCFCGVQNLTGIAFHSYSDKHAKKTFDGVEKDFEIDWIFVNSCGVFVIEVGAGKNQRIIKEKVKQITERSKQKVACLLNASKLKLSVDKLVHLIVALPETNLSELKEWMKSDANQKIAYENSLLFFTKDTLTSKLLTHLKDNRMTERTLESLFQQCSIEQTDLKYFSGLFVIGALRSLKPNVAPYSSKQRGFVGRTNELGNFLEEIEFPDNIVLTSEQVDCVRDIIFGEATFFHIVGEAGTGKSTVLLLLLVYYAGRKRMGEHKKFCYFVVPEDKWGFYEFVVDFVEKFCDEDFVSVCPGFSNFCFKRHEHEQKTDKVIFVDELYADSSRYNVSWPLRRAHKTVTTWVSSGQQYNYESYRSEFFDCNANFHIFFMRKWLRSSLHIATVAAKLKRTLGLRSRDFVTLFDSARPSNFFFAGKSQYQVAVEKIDKGLKLHQDLIISYQNTYEYNSRPTRKNAVIYRAQQYIGNLEDWSFTGIEALSVAVLIDIPKVPDEENLTSLQRFLYSAITRARMDVTVYCSLQSFDIVKTILELDQTDVALNLLQSEGSLSLVELQRCWPDDHRQLAFMLLSVQRSDFILTKNIRSLILSSPALVFSTFKLVQTFGKITLHALFIMFALLNPDKSKYVDGYLEKLLEGLPDNLLFCLRHSSFITGILLQVNSWNSSNELLDKYQRLVPFSDKELKANPCWTTLWFTGEDRIAECHPDSWNFEVVFKISCYIIQLQRFSVVRTLISRLQVLLVQNDEKAREIKSSKTFFCAIQNILLCLVKHSQFSLLALSIKFVPEFLHYSDSSKRTMLHLAAQLNYPILFQIISEVRSEAFLTLLFTFNCDERTPLDVAYESKSNQIVNYLFDFYLDSYLERGEPQIYPFSVILSGLGDIDRLKKLLMERPDLVNAAQKESPHSNGFQLACMHSQTEVVQFLLTLNDGAIVSFGNTFLYACKSGSIQILKMIMPKYVDGSLSQMPFIGYALIFAASTPNQKSAVEMFEYLVQYYWSDLICEESTQQIVFAVAFIHRNDALIDFLAAHLEGKRAVSDCAKTFIQASRERSGKEPHQSVGSYRHPFDTFDIKIAHMLLDLGEERGIGLIIIWLHKFQDKIDERSRRNFLVAACERGCSEMVEFFSLYHPNIIMPSAIDNDGICPAEIARRNNQTEVHDYLLVHHMICALGSKFFDTVVDRK